MKQLSPAAGNGKMSYKGYEITALWRYGPLCRIQLLGYKQDRMGWKSQRFYKWALHKRAVAAIRETRLAPENVRDRWWVGEFVEALNAEKAPPPLP